MNAYTHWYSPNGKWAIRQRGDGRLFIENCRTGATDFPVRYPWGVVAYDMYAVPAYVDRAFKRVWLATR